MNTDAHFELDSSVKPHVCIVRITGRMSLERDMALYRTVRNNMGTATKVVLNLLGVTSIDSCGLGELVAIYGLLKKDDMAVCASESVTEVLRITHLNTILKNFETEEAAVRSFRP